ncbi:hypothetical protein [Rhodopseudomonas palustris]|uniref:hypothetical protein n=1 Tax=Rhodopseudomonas palustris TaxID=1076 RepID=UPI0012377AEF|nr:hypothetical protein [Rhodopseudomonas palustris]
MMRPHSKFVRVIGLQTSRHKEVLSDQHDRVARRASIAARIAGGGKLFLWRSAMVERTGLVWF